MTQSGKSPEGQVADAVKHNWVDRNAPAAARPYLRLSRADRPLALGCFISHAFGASF